jgi:hypothetical protein
MTANQPCEHDWKIWPETDGQNQRCMKCGQYRDTPREDRPSRPSRPAQLKPTPAQIEAGARAMYERGQHWDGTPPQWEDVPKPNANAFRDSARFALEAALAAPLQAWPKEPPATGPNYTEGGWSRRNYAAMICDFESAGIALQDGAREKIESECCHEDALSVGVCPTFQALQQEIDDIRAKLAAAHNEENGKWGEIAKTTSGWSDRSWQAGRASGLAVALQIFDQVRIATEVRALSQGASEMIETGPVTVNEYEDARVPVEDKQLPRRWRHKKRGSTYTEICRAELQADRDVIEGFTMIVYRCDDGKYWVRWEEEFEDGRFEALPVVKGDGEPAA